MKDRQALYPHRKNRDGSYDSICPACFTTIARSKIEVELGAFERGHICDSSFLAERGHFAEAESVRHAAPLPPR
jgi:hypothetical protein